LPSQDYLINFVTEILYYKKPKMKNSLLILLLIGAIITGGCNSRKRSDEIKNYTYQEQTTELSEQLSGKVGSWVQEGTVCYGLVASIDAKGKVQKGLPVKSKVLTIKSDSLKMKALESVSLAEVKGCTKLGIAKGDTWWETEGDLFKTKEEAVAFLKKNGWYK